MFQLPLFWIQRIDVYSVYSVTIQSSKTENPFSQSRACNFIKKETLAQVFSCEFCEISKNTFSTEHIRTTASAIKSTEQGEMV